MLFCVVTFALNNRACPTPTDNRGLPQSFPAYNSMYSQSNCLGPKASIILFIKITEALGPKQFDTYSAYVLVTHSIHGSEGTSPFSKPVVQRRQVTVAAYYLMA